MAMAKKCDSLETPHYIGRAYSWVTGHVCSADGCNLELISCEHNLEMDWEWERKINDKICFRYEGETVPRRKASFSFNFRSFKP
jgi:hypothetical protein